MRNFIFSLFALAIAFAQPSIDSVWFTEETDCDGRNVVEICYILSSDTPDSTYTISVQMSGDSGATWTVPLDSIWDEEGDIGAEVDTGLHCFYWEMGEDLPDSEGCYFMVKLASYYSELDTIAVIDSFDMPFRPYGAAFDGTYLWVTTWDGSSADEWWLRQLTIPTLETPVFQEIYSYCLGGPTGSIEGYHGLAYSHGLLWLFKRSDGDLYKYDISSNTFGVEISITGSGQAQGATFINGSIYLINGDGQSYMYDMITYVLTTGPNLTDFSNLAEEHADDMEYALGDIFIVRNDGKILRYKGISFLGVPTFYSVPYSASSYDYCPEGLTFDGTHLWYTNQCNNKFYKISVYDIVIIANSIVSPLDSRPSIVSITSPTSIIPPDDTYTFQWTVDDMFWANDPCSVYISVGGMRESHIVTGTEFEWTAPSEPCAACTLIVAARDSFCNWGYDTCTFAVGISYECDAHPDPFTPNGDRINPKAIFDYPTKGIDDGNITITIFDMKNRLVRTLENGISIWNGKDEAGNAMPKGPYLYIIKKGSEVICHGTIHLAR